ncbi:hypothetical protein MY857_09070, partial [Haemophilus influenzae]
MLYCICIKCKHSLCCPTNQPTNQNSNVSEQLEQINVSGSTETINVKEKKVGETQISAKKLAKQQASDSR